MITRSDYFDRVQGVDFSEMEDALRLGHEFVQKVTKNGKSWELYKASEKIRNTIDLYFKKIDAFLNQKESSKTQAQPLKTEKRTRKSRPQVNKHKKHPIGVERISDEVRFIRRYVNLNGKTKTKDEILRFLNSVQKAILEKKIRKTSQFAEQIRYIQDKLVEVYNTMKDKIALILKPEMLEKLKSITDGEKVMSSVSFIKRYISLNGKTGVKERAGKLLIQIERAYETKQITDTDPYVTELHEIKNNLANFLSQKSKVLEIEKSELNGLKGIIECDCQNLNGVDGPGRRPVVMNSMDFANLEFKTLGFTDKWLTLIGDPSGNFTIMVFGLPKMGKSYLCVEFAGYLARSHGEVLYVAKEEGLDKTLQDKLNDKNVAHPNLYVASVLPSTLDAYDFIFLDSVNSLGLKPEDLRKLRATYPTKAFVFIFQTTKDGKFRGANSFQHDVDSVIEVYEKGKALQYGRFNQGGEMSFY